MKILDPHLHLFDLTLGQYSWLKPENAPYWPDKALINRNFNESDLMLEPPLQLWGFVHIEAGFDNLAPWREIEWLEATCQLPFRSVACVHLDAESAEFDAQLVKLVNMTSVVGVRHILDQQATELLSRPDIVTKFRKIAEADLHFELQVSVMDTEVIDLILALLPKLSSLKFVLNHAGFPPYATQAESLAWRQWHDNLTRLAHYPNVYFKCSGFEMVERNYEPNWQQTVLAAGVELFGLQRVMVASNFPLCQFSSTYSAYWQQTLKIAEPKESELLFKNAYKFYRFA